MGGRWTGRWALGAAAALAAALAARPGGAGKAEDDALEGAPVHVEMLDRESEALLLEADAAAARGEAARAAEKFRVALERALDRGIDALVPASRARGAGDRSDARAVSFPLFAGAIETVRARLQALGPPGLAAYRSSVDGRARAAFEEAIAARDEAALEAALARWLFASGAERAATLLGDLYLERGDALGAAATYGLVARRLGPAAARRMGPRLALARRGLAQARRGAVLPPGAGLEDGRIEIIALSGDEAAPALSWSAPEPLPEGRIALPRGSRLVVLGGPGGAARVSFPPAGAGDSVDAPADSSHGAGPVRRHRASASRGVLCAALARSRVLDGDEWPGISDAPIPGMAYDLFAFDVSRDARLLWTTAERRRFGSAGEWLGSVEWPGPPLVAAGRVFAAATTRGPEPEVYVAAFDADVPGRLRWRRFLCARGFAPEEQLDRGAAIQPELALAGGTLVVDTGLGVVAGLDAHRGDILWLARFPRGRLEPDGLPWRRGRGGHAWSGARLAARPLACEDGATVVVSPDEDGTLYALDAETGRPRWRAVAGGALEPIGVAGGALLAVGPGEVAAFDLRTGKRLCEGLALPGAPNGRAALFAPAAPDEVARALVPLSGALLAVALLEAPGRARRLEAVDCAGLNAADGADVVPVPAGAAIVCDGAVAVIPLAREAPEGRASAADLSAILRAYGAWLDESETTDAIKDLFARAAGAPGGPPRSDLRTVALEPGRPGEAIVARARLANVPGARRIAITIDAAKRIGVEVVAVAE